MTEMFGDEAPDMFDAENPPFFVTLPEGQSHMYILTEDGRVFADLGILAHVMDMMLTPLHDEARDAGDEVMHAYWDGNLRVVDALGQTVSEVRNEAMLFGFSQALENTDLSALFAEMMGDLPVTDEDPEAFPFG